MPWSWCLLNWFSTENNMEMQRKKYNGWLWWWSTWGDLEPPEKQISISVRDCRGQVSWVGKTHLKCGSNPWAGFPNRIGKREQADHECLVFMLHECTESVSSHPFLQCLTYHGGLDSFEILVKTTKASTHKKMVLPSTANVEYSVSAKWS